jgi:hypothetical protein
MKRRLRRKYLGTGEAGSMTVSFVLGMTFLVIPSLMLMLAAPVWEARSTDASDEAHAAVRALALSPDWSEDQTNAAQALADAIADEDIPSGDVSASYTYTLPAGGTMGADGSLPPGTLVTVAVTVVVPAGFIPGIGTYASVHHTATYSGTIDLYAADNT